MKNHVWTIIRLVVASAGIVYIVWMINWSGHTDEQGIYHEGALATLRSANVGMLLLGLLAISPVYAILGVRWWMLMRARGLQVSLGKAFRLTMVGNFFNYCMPGMTGGDVVKAYYAARGSGAKADAVVSILVDRAAGMLGLVLLAGIISLFMLGHDTVRWMALYIWAGIGILAVGAVVYLDPRPRRWLALDRWLYRLPGGSVLKSIDDAATAYRQHLGTFIAAIVLSILLHLSLALGTSLAGYALGMQRPLGLMLTVVPIIFFGAAIPISYQGLGIMEAIALPLLVEPPMCTQNQVIGMLLLARFFQLFYSLLGALFLLRGDIHLHPQATEVEIEPEPAAA